MPDYLRDLRGVVGHATLVLPSVSGFVLDDTERLLLIRHAVDGRWVVPGGCVEPDEAPVDAVIREMREETGLTTEPVKLLGVFGGPDYRIRYPNGDVVSYVVSAFECRLTGGTLRADGREALEARFFSPDELMDVQLSGFGHALLGATRFARPF
jgi:ADP-ribose pyrophosphatase YjhB (NUDIX family)